LNWKLERDYPTKVPDGIERLCDLCGIFAPFAVKVSTFLQFPKTEPYFFKPITFPNSKYPK
jgi:hypothetical protein